MNKTDMIPILMWSKQVTNQLFGKVMKKKISLLSGTCLHKIESGPVRPH